MSRTHGLLAIFLTIVCMTTISLYLYSLYSRGATSLSFSSSQMLGVLWGEYKERYLEAGTYRPIDFDRRGITTSEGVSYSMLRAVILSDRETFDASWKFAEENLRRPNDRLYAWLFGEQADGTYGVLIEESGDTAASDADSDIALALIFAYSRWQDPRYMVAAQEILRSMWEQYVVEINGIPYLLANDREKIIEKDELILNPSYLSPYAYRIFAHADPAHPWRDLVDSSYDVLEVSMQSGLDAPKSAGLPPDWVHINRETGAITAIPNSTLTTNYGYDAMRVPWRLALDYYWFEEPRAKTVMASMEPLYDEWIENGSLATVHAHDGRIIEPQESPALYGATLGYFMLHHPEAARDIYEQKLRARYNPDTLSWHTPLSYYDDNWAWFGMALYSGEMHNLALAWCPLALGEPGSCLESATSSASRFSTSTRTRPIATPSL